MIGALWFDNDPETTKTILKNLLWIAAQAAPNRDGIEEGGRNLAASKNS
jgi:hypothetical protein